MINCLGLPVQCPLDLYLVIDVSGTFADNCKLVRDALIAAMQRPDLDVQFSSGLQMTVVKFRGQSEFVLRPRPDQSKEEIINFFNTFNCDMPTT